MAKGKDQFKRWRKKPGAGGTGAPFPGEASLRRAFVVFFVRWFRRQSARALTFTRRF